MRVLAVGIGLARRLGTGLRPIWARREAVSVCVVRLVEARLEQAEQLPKRVCLRYKDFPLQQWIAGKPSGLCRDLLSGSRGATYLSYAIVGTMAEVGVRRPTARALVLESTKIISPVCALIQTNL
jgi:hypothetical protein